jgi:hypothetical protein
MVLCQWKSTYLSFFILHAHTNLYFVALSVVRSRAQVHSTDKPRLVPLPDEDEDDNEADSDDSDRKSKMSFSYWGADKITIQKPLTIPNSSNTNDKARNGAGGTGTGMGSGTRGTRMRGPIAPSSYGRESSANAKFGNRLVSADSGPASARAANRRAQGIPSVRRGHHAASDEGHGRGAAVKSTVTRPAWDGSKRPASSVANAVGASSAGAGGTGQAKRTRNSSQTSAATRVATSATVTKALSPVPSEEDSGVRLYQQVLAQNPSLTRVA